MPESEVVVHNSDTAKAGNDGKELRMTSRKVAEAGAVEKFFVRMKKEGVGTHTIESRARKFQMERDSKEGSEIIIFYDFTFGNRYISL